MTNQYNAFSQRVLKTADENQYTYIYNTAGQLLEERNKLQNTVRDYVYADGQLIAAVENNIITYIVTDHLNAPQLVMDSTGKQIWSAKYDAFGKTTIINNYKLNLRANGQYQDGETGLYYNWYRYYDPELGRYLTSDPLGLEAGNNTYIYVNGNPINYTDPTGQCPCCIAGGVSALVELTSQGAKNGWSGINWSEVIIAGGVGAVGGAGFGVLSKYGLLAKATSSIGGSGITSGAQQMAVNACRRVDLFDDVHESILSGLAYGTLGLGLNAGSVGIGSAIGATNFVSKYINAAIAQRFRFSKIDTAPVKDAYKASFERGVKNGDILETYVPPGVQIAGSSIDWYKNAKNNYGR